MVSYRLPEKNDWSTYEKILFLVCVFGLSCVSRAQDKTAWSSLTGLNAGQKIQIVDTQSKKHSGIFVSASDTAISYSETTGDHSIEKQNVRSVTLMENKHRLRNTLILNPNRRWRWSRDWRGGNRSRRVYYLVCEPCQGCWSRCSARRCWRVTVGLLLPSHHTIYSVAPN